MVGRQSRRRQNPLPEEGNPEMKIFEPNEAGAAVGPRRAERERE